MAEYKIEYHDGGEVHDVFVAEGEFVLDALLRAGFDHPYSCRQGVCTTCKVRLLSGNLEQEQEEACILSEEQLRVGERLICVGVAKSDIAITTD